MKELNQCLAVDRRITDQKPAPKQTVNYTITIPNTLNRTPISGLIYFPDIGLIHPYDIDYPDGIVGHVTREFSFDYNVKKDTPVQHRVKKLIAIHVKDCLVLPDPLCVVETMTFLENSDLSDQFKLLLENYTHSFLDVSPVIRAALGRMIEGIDGSVIAKYVREYHQHLHNAMAPAKLAVTRDEWLTNKRALENALKQITTCKAE